MARKISILAKLYHGAANANPTNEVPNVRDLSTPDEFGEADITTRGSVFELVKPTMRKFSLEWQMNWDEADTDFTAILTAYRAGTPIALKTLSSATGAGCYGNFVITKCSRNEPLKDTVVADIIAKPNGDLTWVDAVVE